MDKKIKQYADAGDLTSLKYIFVDSLDVDPTFEQYEEAYDYCKSIPGLLEQHTELTPFISDASQWTETYWAKLKMDLKKNFSDQRMSHMRKVAKVFLADKAQRILKERQATSKSTTTTPMQTAPHASTRPASPAPKVQSTVPSEAEQEKTLQEERQRIKAENRRMAAEQEAKKRAAAARAAALEKENQRFESQQRTESGAFPKKAVGIAIAVVAVVVAVVVFLLLKSRNPV